jgi:hypothetical protein
MKTDILQPFKDVILQSENFDQAFNEVSKINGVPREVSEYFFKKYNPNYRLDRHETFLVFYTEVKQQQTNIN